METLFLLMKKTRVKKFKVKMFYHLQNLFWGFLSGEFLAWGVLSGGLCPGVFVRRVFVLIPSSTAENAENILYDITAFCYLLRSQLKVLNF